MISTARGAGRHGLRRAGRSRRVARCVGMAVLAVLVAVLDGASAPELDGQSRDLIPVSASFDQLPFPFLTGELAAAFQLDGLPPSFLDTLLDDALQLHALSSLLRPGVKVRQWQPKEKPGRYSIEQLIELVSQIDFPDGLPNEIQGAEYWVEVRKNGGRRSNNVMLFDKDVGHATNQQQMRFPALSTTTFLTDGGAPTLILNRTTDVHGSLFVPAVPSQGYLTVSAAGKHVRFSGRAQHGVLGEACTSGCDENVVAIRINWWAHKSLEPPYCKRLSEPEIAQAGYTVFGKAEMQHFKEEIKRSEPARAIQSKSLMAETLAPRTKTVRFILPPVRAYSLFSPLCVFSVQLCPGHRCSMAPLAYSDLR